MRKGFEGLAGLVRAQLGEEPLSGHLFVFSNAARTRVKILFWDGSGLWVCGKRRERGRFCWPTLEQGKEPGAKLRLSNAELAMLLGGLDFGPTRKKTVLTNCLSPGLAGPFRPRASCPQCLFYRRSMPAFGTIEEATPMTHED